MKKLLGLLLLSQLSIAQIGIGNVLPLEQLHVSGNDANVRIDGLSQSMNPLNNGIASNVMVDVNGKLIIKEVVSSGGGGDIIASSIYKTLEDFGAIGDGVTDDTSALQNAIDSGSPIFILPKTYLINSSVTATNNVFLTGAGASSVLKTTSNKVSIKINGYNNTFSNFSMLGSGVGSAQNAIYVTGYYNYTGDRQNNILTGLRISNFGGSGITAYKFYGSDLGTRYEGSLTVSDCIIQDCNYGIRNTARGEYNIYNNIKIQNCNQGFYTDSGNVSFIGGSVTGCSNTGFNIAQGTNDGHSQVVGTMINHNTNNIFCSQDRTYTFANCTIYVGNVKTSGNGKTLFKGCDFYLSGNTLQVNSKAIFSNCDFDTLPTTYTSSISPILSNCYNDMTLITSF